MMSRYAEEMRVSSLASHQNRMRSSDFTSYNFSTYMRGEQEWVTSVNDRLNRASDDRRNGAISKGPKSISNGPFKLVFFTSFF
jgi:hypothetical protein